MLALSRLPFWLLYMTSMIHTYFSVLVACPAREVYESISEATRKSNDRWPKSLDFNQSFIYGKGADKYFYPDVEFGGVELQGHP